MADLYFDNEPLWLYRSCVKSHFHR